MGDARAADASAQERDRGVRLRARRIDARNSRTERGGEFRIEQRIVRATVDDGIDVTRNLASILNSSGEHERQRSASSPKDERKRRMLDIS